MADTIKDQAVQAVEDCGAEATVHLKPHKQLHGLVEELTDDEAEAMCRVTTRHLNRVASEAEATAPVEQADEVDFEQRAEGIGWKLREAASRLACAEQAMWGAFAGDGNPVEVVEPAYEVVRETGAVVRAIADMLVEVHGSDGVRLGDCWLMAMPKASLGLWNGFNATFPEYTDNHIQHLAAMIHWIAGDDGHQDAIAEAKRVLGHRDSQAA